MVLGAQKYEKKSKKKREKEKHKKRNDSVKLSLLFFPLIIWKDAWSEGV